MGIRIKSLFLLLVFLIPVSLWGLDAFPGAVGLGKNTLGGRYGTPTVYKVTNLNNSGAGSFREACEASGARYVVFAVSGDIHLSALLQIKNPYITIAGQTSPGGIAVSGNSFYIATHDVIVQHMRFRTGITDEMDTLNIWGPRWNDDGQDVYNVILDHCSITWGVDETCSVTGGALNVTFQYCLIGAGSDANGHSKGLMVSGKYDHDTSVSLYRNYFPGSEDRNPLIWNPFGSYVGDTEEEDNTMLVDAVNNVSYNWYHGNRPMIGGWRNSVNWIGNYAKGGPISYSYGAIAAEDPTSPTGEDIYPMLYLLDNFGYDYSTGAFGTGEAGEWLIDYNYQNITADEGFKQSTRFAVDYPLTASTMNATLAATIVSESGATVPITDEVDTVLKNDYANNTGVGIYPSSVTYPDDWPTYSTSGDNPTDTDSDGMWDATETTVFGSLDNTATGDADSDGYLNIEEYLFYLGGYQEGETPSTPTIRSGSIRSGGIR